MVVERVLEMKWKHAGRDVEFKHTSDSSVRHNECSFCNRLFLENKFVDWLFFLPSFL